MGFWGNDECRMQNDELRKGLSQRHGGSEAPVKYVSHFTG